jgi:glycosyltransferase involved in cell wall biosynthesis
MKDSVSIIMPIYNVESYIEATLSSVFNQTYKNIEYILVDDCGTDNSMNKIYEMLESDIYKDKNVKVIKHECNKGVSAARNTGVTNSSSEYIFFMDSDDIITPNCIELHMNAMKKSKLDFTVGGIETVGSKTVHIRRLDNKIVEGRVVDAFLKRGWDPGPCNKLINKDFLLRNNIQFTDGIRFEDILWAYYMSKNANRIELIAEQTYKYMMHKG